MRTEVPERLGRGFRRLDWLYGRASGGSRRARRRLDGTAAALGLADAVVAVSTPAPAGTAVPARMPLRLALLGVGTIGQLQLEVLAGAAETEFQVVAVSDSSRTVPVPEGLVNYVNYHDMLARADIDVVAVNTPPAEHQRMALDVLRAGKHVMVEKPPALTLSGCEEMAATAADAGLVLFMAFHARYHQVVEAARSALRGQTVERVCIEYRENVHAYHAVDKWVFLPHLAGGGVLMDSGVNALSILNVVAPSTLAGPIDSAKLSYVPSIAVEVGASVSWRFADGSGFGELEMDWRWEGPESRRLTVVTSEHEYVLDLVQEQLFEDGAELFDGSDRRQVDQHAEYRGVYRDFAAHVRSGRSLSSTAELDFVLRCYATGA